MSRIYVVTCPQHGKQIISSTEYFDVIMNPKVWECPLCYRESRFDDAYDSLGMMKDL